VNKTIVFASVSLLAISALPRQARAQTNWADSITIKGDVRYRYESIEDDSKGDYTRQRDRLRARLSADVKVSDDLKAGIGFSTGQADPTGGNETLSGGFSKKEMRLDTAYFDWTWFNQNSNALNLVAGKMNPPFITISDLIWDPDLRPEGAVLKGQSGIGPLSVLANAGCLWVNERSKDSDDTMLYAGQLALKYAPMPEVTVTFGASYYEYGNMQGYDVIDWQGLNTTFGNSTVAGTVSGSTTNKAYTYEYKPIEYFAQAVIIVHNIPITLYAQTVSNDEAPINNDGVLCGIGLGKVKEAGSYEIGYRYAKLEKDAVVGAFTDSDRWGGGTDGKGSKVYGKYQITKNLQAAITYFMDDKLISDPSKTTDYKRLQADLMVSF
jgi:hypothetical protein